MSIGVLSRPSKYTAAHAKGQSTITATLYTWKYTLQVTGVRPADGKQVTLLFSETITKRNPDLARQVAMQHVAQARAKAIIWYPQEAVAVDQRVS